MLTSANVRSLRPDKPEVDPWTPHGKSVDIERLPGGGRAHVLTAFLSGRECPFTCVFCDLWQYTTDAPTPPGALVAQLRQLLAERQLGSVVPDVEEDHIKLYNASNFFDLKAVPASDDVELSELLCPFDRIIVESHPRLISQRCFDVACQFGAGRLQVAMGLETVHPQAQPQLGKGADLDDYRRAAERLHRHGIAWRAFVLVGSPFVPLDEAALWAERSAAFAFDLGAIQVALIPVRGGNGALEELARRGDFQAPSLGHLEEAFDRCLGLQGSGIVTADTWDLERFATCPACREDRSQRLGRMNLSGRVEPRVHCQRCESDLPAATL